MISPMLGFYFLAFHFKNVVVFVVIVFVGGRKNRNMEGVGN